MVKPRSPHAQIQCPRPKEGKVDSIVRELGGMGARGREMDGYTMRGDWREVG